MIPRVQDSSSLILLTRLGVHLHRRLPCHPAHPSRAANCDSNQTEPFFLPAAIINHLTLHHPLTTTPPPPSYRSALSFPIPFSSLLQPSAGCVLILILVVASGRLSPCCTPPALETTKPLAPLQPRRTDVSTPLPTPFSSLLLTSNLDTLLRFGSFGVEHGHCCHYFGSKAGSLSFDHQSAVDKATHDEAGYSSRIRNIVSTLSKIAFSSYWRRNSRVRLALES
jgi:hypothetical protein